QRSLSCFFFPKRQSCTRLSRSAAHGDRAHEIVGILRCLIRCFFRPLRVELFRRLSTLLSLYNFTNAHPFLLVKNSRAWRVCSRGRRRLPLAKTGHPREAVTTRRLFCPMLLLPSGGDKRYMLF